MTTYRPQSLCGKRRGSGASKEALMQAYRAGYNDALRMVARKPTHGALLLAYKQGKMEARGK